MKTLNYICLPGLLKHGVSCYTQRQKMRDGFLAEKSVSRQIFGRSEKPSRIQSIYTAGYLSCVEALRDKIQVNIGDINR